MTAAVHVFYRYYAGSNGKSRPGYFSKALALESFLRAVEDAGDLVRVSFMVDGPAPAEALRAMQAAGEVVHGRWGSNRSSYREMVSRAALASTELVWMSEDDYLYEVDALTALCRAADAVPEADWFALSGPTPPDRLEMRRAQGPVALAPLARPGGVAEVDGRLWHRIESTTSTFGARTLVLRRDRHLLRAVPFTGAAWDRTTFLAVQGAVPYPWRHVLDDLVVPSTPQRRRALRVVWRLGSRVVVNLRSARRPSHRGVMVAPVTALIGHMDLPYEERPAHWDSVATTLLQTDSPDPRA